MTEPVDVNQVMRDIRRRIRGVPRGGAPADRAVSPASILTSIDWTRLEDLAKILQARSRYVGELPPRPATFRARIGAGLVGLMRRALFWYTSQIQEFQAVSSHAFQEELECLKALSQALAAETAEREALAARLEEALRAGPAAGESSSPPGASGSNGPGV
jgi:hypothetical protein